MKLQTLTLRLGDQERRANFAVVETTDLPEPESFLNQTDLAAFSALRFPLKQQGFLLGRLVAKRALGALLGETDLRRIEIRSGVFGQPLVRHPRAGGIDVTLSHSHGLAVALAHPIEMPMGVDLETVAAASTVTILGELQLSAVEKAWLAAGSVDEATVCGVLWTAREAFGKSLKIGLNCPLGILALGHIEPAGTAAWESRYANFPQSQCLSQAVDDRILSLAMPIGTSLSAWPRLR